MVPSFAGCRTRQLEGTRSKQIQHGVQSMTALVPGKHSGYRAAQGLLLEAGMAITSSIVARLFLQFQKYLIRGKLNFANIEWNIVYHACTSRDISYFGSAMSHNSRQ